MKFSLLWKLWDGYEIEFYLTFQNILLPRVLWLRKVLMVRVDLKRLMWQDSTHLYLYISSLNLSPSLPSSLQYQYLVKQDQTLSDFRLKYCSMVQTKSVELVKIFILFIPIILIPLRNKWIHFDKIFHQFPPAKPWLGNRVIHY